MADFSSMPIIRYDLASYGLVTQVISQTDFTIAGLIGQGNGRFQGSAIYVLNKADGTTTAPHREQQVCTAYASATGQFTHGAFSATLSVGDAVLLLHESLGAASYIRHLTRPQAGTQATTAVLAVIGAAIVNAIPSKTSGFLSLHNMQAGDTFLVIEEIHDQDDTTYREYGRQIYAGVQAQPMVWFEPKVCRGWRVRIQRTAGADRNVTYQFLEELANA